jgi:hypothetical protein
MHHFSFISTEEHQGGFIESKRRGAASQLAVAETNVKPGALHVGVGRMAQNMASFKHSTCPTDDVPAFALQKIFQNFYTHSRVERRN